MDLGLKANIKAFRECLDDLWPWVEQEVGIGWMELNDPQTYWPGLWGGRGAGQSGPCACCVGNSPVAVLRDHPTVIKRRFTSVLVVSALAPFFVWTWREFTGVRVSLTTLFFQVGLQRPVHVMDSFNEYHHFKAYGNVYSANIELIRLLFKYLVRLICPASNLLQICEFFLCNIFKLLTSCFCLRSEHIECWFVPCLDDLPAGGQDTSGP